MAHFRALAVACGALYGRYGIGNTHQSLDWCLIKSSLSLHAFGNKAHWELCLTVIALTGFHSINYFPFASWNPDEVTRFLQRIILRLSHELKSMNLAFLP